MEMARFGSEMGPKEGYKALESWWMLTAWWTVFTLLSTAQLHPLRHASLVGLPAPHLPRNGRLNQWPTVGLSVHRSSPGPLKDGASRPTSRRSPPRHTGPTGRVSG